MFEKGQQMAKDKKKKDKAKASSDKPVKVKKGKKSKPSAAACSEGGAEKLNGAVRAAKEKVLEIATNPVVAEIVAATLVAAAAALRNPEKARQLAGSAGEELKGIAKGATGNGGAFWELATDVARRTILALDEETGSGLKRRSKTGKG